MTLLSSNIKTNILTKLDDIINIEDPNWSNLGIDLKLKIVHNLCNFLKNNMNSHINTHLINQKNHQNYQEKLLENSINIPLKNQRAKKIIELSGINKQTNSELFNEFRKELVMMNKDFRKTFNSKNKQYCFGNLSNTKYQSILNNYNQNIFKFLNSNIDKIDSDKLYSNLLGSNQQKTVNLQDNKSILKINKITHINEFLNIEFNNDVSIKLELFLTSEKITSNIPAKYKISLTNIF
jgi:hypothetical protein